MCFNFAKPDVKEQPVISMSITDNVVTHENIKAITVFAWLPLHGN